ncbi:hypothetical protein [Arthrobacter echini]|nr:hypothetical protein [Arthrobacter echini]
MQRTDQTGGVHLSRRPALIITEVFAPTFLVGVFLLTQPLLTPGVT